MENKLNPRKRAGPNKKGKQAAAVNQVKVLEVADGCDIISALNDFASCYEVGVSVISTNGFVRNLIVYQPNVSSQTCRFSSYDGFYNLVSLRGNFNGCLSLSSFRQFPSRYFVTFSCHQGQLYDGIVSGKLTAAGNVFLSVSVFTGTDSIKLPPPMPPPMPLVSPDSQAMYFDPNKSMRVADVFSGTGTLMTANGVPTGESSRPPISLWNLMSAGGSGSSSTAAFMNHRTEEKKP